MNPLGLLRSGNESRKPSRREPILGYRWWWAFRDSFGRPRLRAWVWNVHWRVPGITEAVHWDEHNDTVLGGVAHMLPVPAEACNCGLYAWFRLPEAIEGIARFNQFHGDRTGLMAIAGAVVTGGETILHGDEGMRTRFARPVAFGRRNAHHPGDDDSLLTDLATAFAVPVMPLDKLERYAREFGTSIEEALSP